jgi:hypothetical protein
MGLQESLQDLLRYVGFSPLIEYVYEMELYSWCSDNLV